MAKSIMIQGTTSNAGKSILTAALCRIFYQDGHKVAPFKSQNMALNSFITEEGLEMGRAQVVQAEAANIKPDVRMNPILLKPTSDKGSQVIINGEVVGNMKASEYYKNKVNYKPIIMEAYNKLAEEFDIIVIEGAGSPAEINLKENDIVNMGMAKMANAPVLIVADIDRGGVFAALYGTYMLQDDDEKAYIKGNIINKFRGDVKILQPGIDMIENLMPIPVVGVVPYCHLNIDDEDSLSENLINKQVSLIDIAVIKLPKISNFTDFNAFDIFAGCKVRYIENVHEFKKPDLLILPGSKNTISDLLWLRESGLESKILKYKNSGGSIFGICGGFQMLCETISDPNHLEGGGTHRGLGFVKGDTIFEQQKTRTRVNGTVENAEGIFSVLNGINFEGYEIHMGTTKLDKNMNKLVDLENNITLDGYSIGNVYGTYVHGIFDSAEIILTIVKALATNKGIDYELNKNMSMEEFKDREYDKLADIVRESLDMEYIYSLLEM
ncbi:MAG: cobyric acid synthase CobQ [Epulopiscium sp. Nuni2H_MBin003]|nr:MAG: cobyric acid synthase CobQ [Epulopiscium sp. Nuni2H_MBin003]